RYYLAGPHYRSPIDYTPEALSEAATAFRRLENFVQRASERATAPDQVQLPAEFSQAMDDDLATPRALGVVHETARAGNQALSDGDTAAAAAAVAQVRAMLGVLGIDPLDEHWQQSQGGPQRSDESTDALVELVLQQREAARRRKDYAAADAVRDQLATAGVVLEDTASGTRWNVG
ncbi:MAG: DALR domain-containing protein, partial [Mycobacteriales bacterium]